MCVSKVCVSKLCDDKMCDDKMCEDKLCVSKLCGQVDDKMCEDKLCVSKWCEDKLCVDKLCVGMSKLCVEADDGRRRAAGYRTKNKNPTQRCGELTIISTLHVGHHIRKPVLKTCLRSAK